MEENYLESFRVSSIMNIKKYQVYRYIISEDKKNP